MTITIFRKWPDSDGGDVIALFPGIAHDGIGHCSSYQHIGQHGGANYAHVIRATRPATDIEYTPLLKELRSIGYADIEIRKRWSRQR